MNEADHKAFEKWWDDVPKINFAGTESEKNAAEAAWIARDTATAGLQNIIADEYLAQVVELVKAVEAINGHRYMMDSAFSKGATEHVDIAVKLAAKLKEQQDETK